MTEYWVSQGNHWCEYCRVWLSNNTATIRMHESGTKHKLAVADKLRNLQKDAVAQERERKEAEATIGKIEEMAQRQYKRDLAEQRKVLEQQEREKAAAEARENSKPEAPQQEKGVISVSAPSADDPEWSFDSASGYFFNGVSGFYYDSSSGLYYSESLGKWATRDEMQKVASQKASNSANANASHRESTDRASSQVVSSTRQATGNATTSVGGKGKQKRVEMEPPAEGPVRKKPAANVKGSLGRGVQSSVAVKKKDTSGSGGVLSKEEKEARAAREAARKRIEERDKRQMGLYAAFR